MSEAEIRLGRRVGPPGAQAHCLEDGAVDAPVALLIHGLGGLAQEIAAPLAQGLAGAGFHVLAIDRPGYGYSDAQPACDMGPARQAAWLALALTALGVRPSVIVAHSFGAAVALWLAARLDPAPPLTLINPFCRPTPPAPAPLLRLAAAPSIGTFVRRRVAPRICRRLVAWQVGLAAAPERPTATLTSLPAELIAQESALVAMAAELRGFNADAQRLPGERARLRQPIVAVTGTHDRVVRGERHGAWLAANFPQVERRRLSGGHLLHHTRPSQVIAAAAALA